MSTPISDKIIKNQKRINRVSFVHFISFIEKLISNFNSIQCLLIICYVNVNFCWLLLL